MKSIMLFSVLAVLSFGAVSHAADSEFFEKTDKQMRPISKVEALILKATKPEAVVVKCQEQALSDKATLKTK